jgi:DNA-binding NtrC family response regulator
MSITTNHIQSAPTELSFSTVRPTTNREVLLISLDSSVGAAVLEAAAEIQRPVQLAKTTREGFRALFEHYTKVDVVIVDLESTTHGLAIVEMLTGGCNTPPVITIIGPQQYWMGPIARLRRNGGCTLKPVSSDKLAMAMEKAVNRRGHQCSCDRWGHLQKRFNQWSGNAQGFAKNDQATGASVRCSKLKGKH